jgi:uncharacterized membrane protein
VIIDFVWLSLMGPKFYKVHLGDIWISHFHYTPAIIFYTMYAFGISYFIIIPGLSISSGVMQIAFGGFMLGLITYGAYDLTNQATVKNWPIIVTVVDMLWGAILTALGSIITYNLMAMR